MKGRRGRSLLQPLSRAADYDFVGQTAALRRAREISAGDVAYWSNHPTLARVVSASYPVSRARQKSEEWSRQPRGRRLPGYAPFRRVLEAFISPFALGPWSVLVLAQILRLLRSWRGMARECAQCGRPTCKYCRRYGDPLGLCNACSRHLNPASPAGRPGRPDRRSAAPGAEACLALPASLPFLPRRPRVFLKAARLRFPDPAPFLLSSRVRGDQQPALRTGAACAGERMDRLLARGARRGGPRLGDVRLVVLEAAAWGLKA